MTIGREQSLSPSFGALTSLYIRLLGFPAIGLQMRGRRILPHVRRAVKQLQAQPGTESLKLCDAGSGRGAFSFALARAFPNLQVTGLEYEEHLISHCEGIKAESGLNNVRFQRWDITKPLEGGPWDVVVNIETLEHIDDHESAARNLYEAVAPGGILVCHVPSYYSRMFGKESVNIDVPGHVRPGYHGPDLLELLQNVGFEVSDWTSTYGSLETWCQRFSYRVTGAAMKNAGLYSLLFPFLRVIGWIGGCFNPGKGGTNVLVVARKPA